MERFQGENMTGKVLALLLAIILWVYVMNEQNPPVEQTANIKLEVRNVSTGLAVTESPDTIKIRFRGPRGILAGLRVQDISVYVDATGQVEGDHALTVKTALPNALEIIEVSPGTANIKLERQISRQFNVVPKFSGVPTPGTVINTTVISPSAVTVTGPRSKVDAVEAILVPIDVNGLNRNISQEGTPRAYAKNGAVLEQLSINPGKVQIEITILQGILAKVVDIKPVVFGELAPGATITRITTEPEKIEIRGQADAIKLIDWVYTMPVDVTGQSKDVVKDVQLQMKDGIILEKPMTVKVTVRIATPVQGTPGQR
jgi:YbbR domain-containing protein